MADLLQGLLKLAVLVFSVSTMLGVGLGHTVRDVFEPMRDSRGVVRALIANFVLVPLLAYALVQVWPLGAGYATGLMLIATAAGAPLLIKLTSLAGGNQPLSASLLMLLTPVTVLYMPLVVPVLVPDAKADPVAIALPLVLTMILPMAFGMFARARLGRTTEAWSPWLARLSSLALIVTVAATTSIHAGGVRRLVSEGAILAPAVVILGALLIGYVFGREYREGHVTLGLGTAQRNIGAAMVVATQGLDDPDVVVMVVVASIVEFAVLLPIAWGLGRWGRRRERIARV